jgi:hypothetical protein
MANRLELMAANVCQMLKQLVHTAGIPVPGKCDQDSKETDPRIALKMTAIAYGDLTSIVQTCAARTGAGDPFKVGGAKRRITTGEIRC